MNQQAMPTQQQWNELESSQLLLEPRKQVLSVVFRLVAIGALLTHVPLHWVTVWAALIFGANAWMRRLIVAYRTLQQENPNQLVMTSAMSNIVQRYKTAWLLNCVIWCGLSFMSQIWLPIELRLLCVAILNALMFLSLTRTYVDRKLMHQVSAILIVLQLVFVIIRVAMSKADAVVIEQATIYSLYLFLMSCLLWLVGNRFNHMHLLRLDADFAKLQLIKNLERSQTQLHLEQQALVASNKLVQQFYSGAAHDLRQPVYAMQLYTSMLEDDSSLSKVLLPKITQSCISINEMFNTLFDYQQTHMNDTELLEKDNNIQEIFRSLALNFQPIAAGKGLQIRFRPIAGSITMAPLYLTRILSNLIANALRYTHTGGVLVAARKTHTCIRLEVWDTGIGIDDSKLEHIFNEFYKVSKGDVSNEGLGLGLAIAKQLSMRVEHTDISVKSRVGRGSVFTFAVPLERYEPI